MIDLNNPVWTAIRGAGARVDACLRRLEAGEGDFRENVDRLADNTSHQLSWYDVTAYALPHVARLCEKLSVEEKLYLIAQMGPAVAAESQVSLSPDTEEFREFHEGLAPLAQEARELVEHHMEEIKALPKDLPLVFAVAALALLWDRKRAWYLYLYAPWDELPALCPDCDWYEECMDFSLEEEPEFVTPGALDEEGAWLQKLLTEIGDLTLLPRLPYLYGTCTCPECGASGPLWEWIDRAFEEG